MGEILLRAENIDKHFGITHALDNVSFTFNKGEIHALIGENGSGKSTLTSCLTGIYQKDSGKFILEGKEITDQCVDLTFIKGKGNVVQGVCDAKMFINIFCS